MQPLDYEPKRQTRGPPSWPFWLSFAAAYLPGLLILDFVDDMIHRHYFGHPNDGGVMALSLMCSPVIALIAGVIRGFAPRYRTVGFAIAFAIFAPLLLYALWIIVGEFL